MAKRKPVADPILADEDSMLVELSQSGDMGAFSQLVTKYQDRVLNACWRISGNREDAQDLAQEAFLHALKKMEMFERRSGFYTWLFRIAVNLAISHRRKMSRHVTLSLHRPDGEMNMDHQASALLGGGAKDRFDPSARLTARETHRAVADELNNLEDEHRAVMVLKDIEGLDYQQISEILEIPLGTVKSRLHRARVQLRDRLLPILSAEQNDGRRA